MPETPQEHLITVFRKCGGYVVRGLVSPQEYVNKAFDEFSYIDRVYPDVIPALWVLVPEITRGEFIAEVRRAALPGFRWPPFYIGGSRPMTEDELRRDVELRTARVQAWAVEFDRYLANVRE